MATEDPRIPTGLMHICIGLIPRYILRSTFYLYGVVQHDVSQMLLYAPAISI